MPTPRAPVEEGARRAGRPRRDGRRVVGDPTDDILAAAGRLFGEFGVAATTMSRLAREVGLGQSSLYYYFRSREEVVAALVARANVVPLSLIELITSGEGSEASKLYRFVMGDVEALCALPFDINEIHRIAARERDRFAGYWQERAVLERKLAALVKRGMEADEFRPVNASVTALTIISNDEATQNWYRLAPARRWRAAAAALAEMTVAGVLVRGRAVDALSGAAAAGG